MDCLEFNDNITEYEARRLTKKQEDEFLEHKNNCEECRLVFEMLFGTDIEGIESTNYSIDDDVCVTVMDKIKTIEKNTGNIKLQNILHIVFGLVTVSTAIFIIVSLENSLRSIQQNNWNSIDNFSDSLCNAIGLASHSLTSMYLHSIIYIVIAAVFIGLITTVYDAYKTRTYNKKFRK